jgi:hypothetical protein
MVTTAPLDGLVGVVKSDVVVDVNAHAPCALVTKARAPNSTGIMSSDLRFLLIGSQACFKQTPDSQGSDSITVFALAQATSGCVTLRQLLENTVRFSTLL